MQRFVWAIHIQSIRWNMDSDLPIPQPIDTRSLGQCVQGTKLHCLMTIVIKSVTPFCLCSSNFNTHCLSHSTSTLLPLQGPGTVCQCQYYFRLRPRLIFFQELNISLYESGFHDHCSVWLCILSTSLTHLLLLIAWNVFVWYCTTPLWWKMFLINGHCSFILNFLLLTLGKCTSKDIKRWRWRWW